MQSYDPVKPPELDPEAAERAMAQGLQPVSITCVDPGSDVGGVSFITFCQFPPRIGERILLEDGAYCEVTRVVHKLTREPGDSLVVLVPQVYAKRIK